MAIPHLSAKVISRAQGQSVIAAAAYRSGEALYNQQENKTHDYTRKEDIVFKDILTPEDAPAWAKAREQLWNTVEQTEKRKDAQLARSLTLALPRELDRAQNAALVKAYVVENFVAHGMIADICLHESRANDGGKNPHAHVLLTLREVSSDGFGKKNREWNRTEILANWRNSWESYVNHFLAQAGHDARISMKSFADQGIDKEPTIHIGYVAGNLEKQGIETDRGNRNRKKKHKNTLKETARKLYREAPEARTSRADPPPPATLRHVAERLDSAESGGRSGPVTEQPFRQLQQVAQAQHTPPPEPERLQHQQALGNTLARMKLGLNATQTAVKLRTRRLAERAREISQTVLAKLSQLMNNREVAEKIRQEQEKEHEHER